MRLATASAWACPVSARCRPGARPGSTLPVVAVWPWRTSRTSVGGGGLGRDGRAARGGMRIRPSNLQSPSVISPAGAGGDDLGAVAAAVVRCRACPRLVAWREEVATVKRAAHADERYWGRPVPGFGDPAARVLVVGL